jgi:hypothetical protein
LSGVSTNPDVFDPSLQWDSLPSNTYTELGEHLCDCINLNPNAINENTVSTFSIFPNPVLQGSFALKSSLSMESVSILSADGRLIDRRGLQGVTYTNITFPQAEAGVYFIEIVYTDGKKAIQKLLAR